MTHSTTRLLVVGGNGFIGRHIVNHGAALGWHVTSLSLRPVGRSNTLGVRTLAVDAANGVALKEALGDAIFDYAVNCGGYIDHTLFFSGGRRIFDTHIGSILNLVETLNREALRVFVNIGSSDEYGSNPAPQIEIMREAPITPYSLAKVAATHLLQMLYRTENFPAITLRLFLTYGPGQDHRRFLPQIILGCLEAQSFPASEGAQLRDFCFVQDIVDAIFLAFASPAALGEVINIASGQPVSIRQMIESVRRLIGRGEPRFAEIAYRPGENMELYGSIAKAESILGWKPKVTLDIGLEKTIQWIRAKP